MPEHTPNADRSKGGPGSSHEDGDKTSSRTRKGDRTQPQSESLNVQHDEATKNGATDDKTEKANRKSEHGGKP